MFPECLKCAKMVSVYVPLGRPLTCVLLRAWKRKTALTCHTFRRCCVSCVCVCVNLRTGVRESSNLHTRVSANLLEVVNWHDEVEKMK